ncbi:MAG TPA: PIG-L family deacetylase [Coriobacteriia bacterium]|jgi:LmbE family N-acetylglucosaminyl deacetylase
MRGLALRAAKALRLPLLALATVAVGYLAWMGLDGSISGFEKQRLPGLPEGSLGERILVVSPHPDDETLAAGGLIRQSLLRHRRVLVVVVTCGDGFRRIAGAYRTASGTVPPYLRLGEVRAAESREAMRRLGLPGEDLVFLGYPDGSMAKLWSADWGGSATKGTNGRESVPYPFAYRPGAPYRGSSVAADLTSIVASFAPTAVVFPDAEDSNSDHWAVDAFVQDVLGRARFRGARYTYLVHRGHFPFPWADLPEAWLEPPRKLLHLGIEWLSYPLTRQTEQEKDRAVDAYRSQQRAMEPFLASFVRRNELFARPSAPVAAVTGTRASLDASAMPGVIVSDPSADTLLRTVDAGADLRRVALVREPGAIWLGLEANAALAPGITYRLSARLLREDGSTARLDLEIRGRKVRALLVGRDSLDPHGDVESHAKGARTWIRIPASLFEGVSTAMLSAESYQGGMLLDRTAVRSVLLR